MCVLEMRVILLPDWNLFKLLLKKIKQTEELLLCVWQMYILQYSKNSLFQSYRCVYNRFIEKIDIGILKILGFMQDKWPMATS